ncbi:coiled-coil domain-containing protein 148-like [Chanos chanos]|uniref:Coiled-coil domain-containing protein 148-like n=1 Tax=Chanos chanos TaxID=29144 RepID=A0A6J2WHG3_CHACN|nr:coiled-coil domain-containing protein 148 [Chanos chanos]
MSGRDLRVFITNHRADDLEKLTQRIKDGLGSSKYKPVQYEQLEAIVEAKRFSAELTEQKVQRTLHAAQVRKERSQLKQHKQVWCREKDRLCKAGKKAEADVKSFLGLCGREKRNNLSTLTKLLEYDLQLEQEREDFRLATVEPVWQLREDLLFRLRAQSTSANQHAEWEQVLQQVRFVKDQQETIMERLSSECLSLEQEIANARLEENLCPAASEVAAELEKVPEDLSTAECPYPELSSSLIQEFHSLTDKYKARLETIENRLQGLDRYCGWSPEDHLLFQATVAQYPPELLNHRTLYMDMLKRLFPHTSRQELSAHERTWDWYRFSVAQQRLVLQSWQRDHEELFLRALVTIEEARQTHQKQQALQNDHIQQQLICRELREKLQRWRAQQEEVARLEAAIAARWREEEEERLRKEQEKEQARRARQKEQVERFYEEQQRRREEQERRDQHRLAQLRTQMAAQAKRDRERVKYRVEMMRQRMQEREAKEQQRQREEEEREERLQALRNQVAVTVEADPERMMGNTEAWRVRQHPEEDEFVLHRPLYHLYTYTDTQIVSDPRVRLEQALRNAGLHATAYAREVLSGVPPPRPPRRDTESTAFRS